MELTEVCANACEPQCWSQHPGGPDLQRRHFAALFECSGPAAGPDPLGNSVLRHTHVPWIDLVQNLCLAVFATDFVLHLALVEKPRRYLFSFTGLIDTSAVLFFFAPQVPSELLLWVFKFGRIMRVFTLLKFIDEARVLARPAG